MVGALDSTRCAACQALWELQAARAAGGAALGRVVSFIDAHNRDVQATEPVSDPGHREALWRHVQQLEAARHSGQQRRLQERRCLTPQRIHGPSAKPS